MLKGKKKKMDKNIQKAIMQRTGSIAGTINEKLARKLFLKENKGKGNGDGQLGSYEISIAFLFCV